MSALLDPVGALAPTPEVLLEPPQRLRRVLRKSGLVVAGAWIGLLLVAAVAPNLIADGDPLAHDASSILRGPGAEHWFGTDEFGRDQFTRAVHGTTRSLQAAGLAILIGLVVGSGLGLVAGARLGRIDAIIMRLMDMMLAVPSIIISLAIVSSLGRGVLNIAIAIGINSIAGFARLMRSEVLRVRELPYVEAASFAGHGATYTLLRHVVPNASGSVLAAATMDIGTAILAVAALSFLGFGEPPPAPEWGALVAAGRGFLSMQWGLSLLPGMLIVLTVLAVHRVGRAIGGDRSAAVA